MKKIIVGFAGVVLGAVVGTLCTLIGCKRNEVIGAIVGTGGDSDEHLKNAQKSLED